jgi:hypothetical protein
LRATPLTTMAKPISLIRWCSGSMDRPRPRNLRRSDWLFVLDGLPPAVDAAVGFAARRYTTRTFSATLNALMSARSSVMFHRAWNV